MENSQNRFLNEILTKISALRAELSELERQVVEYQRSLEDLPKETPQMPISESVQLAPLDEDLPEADIIIPEVFAPKESEPEAPSSLKVEIDPMAEILPLGEAIGGRKSAVMDRMASHERWRTDIPGAPVSDIRSAISLNDRILFINTLFGEDPIAFKETLSALNGAASFEEGVSLLKERYPLWNTDSDTVYRFMMAVRRKLK